MNLSRIAIAMLAAAAVPSTTAAAAPQTATAPGPSLPQGATVFDPQGGVVGTIASTAGESVVVDTGTHKATLPRSAFAAGPKGPSITATKAQVDALVAASLSKARAEFDAALVPGTEVRGKSGMPIGTIKEVTADQVVIQRTAGPVSLPRAAFGMGANGLAISMTADEFEVAAKAAASQP